MLTLRKTTLPEGSTFKALPSAVERYQALYPAHDRSYNDACDELVEMATLACDQDQIFTNPKRDGQIVAYSNLPQPSWLVIAASTRDDATHVIVTLLAHKDRDFSDELDQLSA